MRTFAFAAVLATASAVAVDNVKFMQWAMDHGKSYDTNEEFYFRLSNWVQTELAVAELNSQNSTATFGHNHMSDWTEAEYKSLLGRIPENDDEDVEYTWLPEPNSSSVDWRNKGAVTGVKDQGRCGSCWSFSTTGAMEGAHKIKSGKLVSLSEQQFVDCDRNDSGCNGGLQPRAMKYAQTHNIELESSYKYTGKDGSCKYSSSKGVVGVKNISIVPRKDTSQLKAAITRQPVAVSIDASGRAFNNYKSGVLTSSQCGTNVDHAVLAVGYGTSNGTPYYLVKNSWSTSWGDKGYIKIGIESGKGVCGIQSTNNAYPSTN